MKLTTLAAAAFAMLANVAVAQTKPSAPPAAAPATQKPADPASASTAAPADYVIGPGDVLTVTVWRDKDMTGDYVVRPDGKMTLPLLGDVHAVGMTPPQLTDKLTQALSKLLVDPNITVGTKEINSRRVYISGGVQKPGPYSLLAPMTVAQLISVAGGFKEYVDTKKIRIVTDQNGKQVSLPFNYKDFQEGKSLTQNIQLKPGDTVLVPEPD